MDTPASNPSEPTKRRRALTRGARAARVAAIGGLAAGASFAAVTGISAATGTSGSTGGSGSSATAPAPPVGGPHGHRGGPFGPGGHLGRGGPGDGGPGGNGGTITAIKGSTLSLRTENGTETVVTSSSTTYRKEMQKVSFSDLAVNDVVHVAATPASTSSATPAERGTGTVDATAVMVVEPSFEGRVTSFSSGTYSLVGRDGQLLKVKPTKSTRYYDGMTQAGASAISVGSHVRAEGPRVTLSDLTADVISVRPTPPAGAPSMPGASNSAGTTAN